MTPNHASLLVSSVIAMVLFSQSAFSTNPMTTSIKSDFETWEGVSAPTTGDSQSIGGYSAGCLSGATRLPSTGKGYAAMRLSRKRRYGHTELTEYIRALGTRLHQAKLPNLLVGDLGPARGGPTRSGHVSHQTGLDADLWLMMSRKVPTKRQRETWGAPAYVKDRKQLKANWSETQVQLISTAADFEQVNRIFVSPAIKRYFCQKFPDAPWLYKLRAWWSHEDHIHVRLNCPKDSRQCEPQAPLDPSVTQCGADLDWWFSKEADDEWQAIINTPAPRVFPSLPQACEDLVADMTPASARSN